MEDILERVGVASSPNHVEVATVSGLASVSEAYICGGCFAGTGTGAGAASLARASKQKSRHQAARGAFTKLPQATGAHVGTANPP